MNRNDSPRNKLFEMFQDLVREYPFEKIPKDFLQSLNGEEETSVSNLTYIDHNYFYKGYPCGNYVQIIAKVFELWDTIGTFPIHFYQINGLNDETYQEIEKLNTKTHLVNQIMNSIKENSKIVFLNLFRYNSCSTIILRFLRKCWY